jgi:hypothetical protein
MKKEVVEYVVIYIECQKVKDKHKHSYILLQPFSTPEWKWEVVTIDFITKLPRIVKQLDSIMVVVDKLINYAHFIPINHTQKEKNILEIYMREIYKLHGVPKAIVSARDSKFT